MLLLLITLFAALYAAAQGPDKALMARILAANFPEHSLTASWKQVKHTPMLEEDLHSEGKVEIRQPDYICWEVLSPIQRSTVLDGSSSRGRFRMPTEKDFQVSVLEGDQYSVQLTPIRRDLKQLMGRIVLVVDKQSLEILRVLLMGLEGEWTQITFHDIVKD